MNHLNQVLDTNLVEVHNLHGRSPIVIVCEHASPFIPAELNNLGLAADVLESHAVWDPGARAVAVELAAKLDAVMVAAKTSRLVYDCNRPPGAPDAMAEKSEVVAVPGNADLSAQARAYRTQTYYEPFRAALAAIVDSRSSPVLVTVHSFTPIYHGTQRNMEIGVLHDSDARLADALLATQIAVAPFAVLRNQPYGPEHGVTHTLQEHALPHGYLNVMIELRNDLIADVDTQLEMGGLIADWISQALARLGRASC